MCAEEADDDQRGGVFQQLRSTGSLQYSTKPLNVYTETVKCLSAFLPPLLRGMININCFPDKQKELIAETVCSEPKS